LPLGVWNAQRFKGSTGAAEAWLAGDNGLIHGRREAGRVGKPYQCVASGLFMRRGQEDAIDVENRSGQLPRAHAASCLRIASTSARRSALVTGHVMFRLSSVSSKIFDTMSLAFSLSSAGTMNHDASSVLVAPRQCS